MRTLGNAQGQNQNNRYFNDGASRARHTPARHFPLSTPPALKRLSFSTGNSNGRWRLPGRHWLYDARTRPLAGLEPGQDRLRKESSQR